MYGTSSVSPDIAFDEAEMWRRQLEGFTKVAKKTDLADGEMMLVEVGDESVLISNLGGSFYAISDECPHAMGSLSDGDVEGDEVECPLHGSRFNLRTGENLTPPAAEPAARYPVRLEGDDILVGPA